jgi:hypothetical protein
LAPPPAEPPKHYPIWPLWYAAIAFMHVRRAGALLVVGLMPGGHAGRLADSPPGGVVETIQTIETDAIEAADEVAPAPRKHRRGRASLSMPYFSFAHTLRPRS